MIDTHTHIYFPEFRDEIDSLMQRCEAEGIEHLILPNVDEESLPDLKSMHRLYPDKTSIAIGLHPTEVKNVSRDFLDLVEQEITTGNYIAIGEVGIDLYWDQSTLEDQKIAFEHQLLLAGRYGFPVIIHSRNAFEETMQAIEKVRPDVPLVFHSFTGGPEDVERIRQGCDPYFGINGVVTYKNASALREALPKIGLERILLETDSPYLTPVPHRGKRNESSFLGFIRDKVAESLEIPCEAVEAETDHNARKVFKI